MNKSTQRRRSSRNDDEESVMDDEELHCLLGVWEVWVTLWCHVVDYDRLHFLLAIQVKLCCHHERRETSLSSMWLRQTMMVCRHIAMDSEDHWNLTKSETPKLSGIRSAAPCCAKVTSSHPWRYFFIIAIGCAISHQHCLRVFSNFPIYQIYFTARLKWLRWNNWWIFLIC